MKYLISLATLLTSFSIQAALNDTHLGNVVAVEREVTDIYSDCVANMKNSAGDLTKPSLYFTCSFDIINKNEISQTHIVFLRTPKKEPCVADGDLINGRIVMLFGLEERASTAAEAKNCLFKRLTGKNSLKAIVHTVQ